MTAPYPDLSAPSAHTPATASPLLEVRDVHHTYRKRGGGLLSSTQNIHALKGIRFSLQAGQSLGIVGESGSGKTTLARLIMALDTPSQGSIWFQGHNLHTLPAPQLRALRPAFLMVFQDPYGSLDPRQRIAIARALISRPQLVVADEPVSALDASVQAQVLKLLQGLQQQGISLILISHDLAVVEHLCDQLCVLYRGEMVEYGPTAQVLQQPQHPYTQQLLAAAS